MTTTDAPWINRITGYGTEAPDQLAANPKNWRVHPKHQQAALKGALDSLGWIQNVIVNQRTGFVVDGHARIALALRHDQTAVPVTYVDLSESEEALALATLDPISAMAGADKDQLEALLAEINTQDEALLDLVAGLGKEHGIELSSGGLTDPDEVPEPPDEPITKPGDLWLLGAHRLLCGDATNASDVELLLDGEQAHCIFTDPPYGIGFRSPRPKPGNQKPAMENDATPDELQRLLRAWLPLAHERLREGGALWACCTAAGPTVVYPLVLAEIARCFQVQDTVVWDKEVWGTGWFFRRQWEAVIFAGKGKVTTWHAGHDQPNVVRYPRLTPQAGEHPTPKPVELVADFVGWVTNEGELVADYFAGSGSTLIAAEQLNRRCYGMEIDPTYCDVIVRRWENFTGQIAIRERIEDAA